MNAILWGISYLCVFCIFLEVLLHLLNDTDVDKERWEVEEPTIWPMTIRQRGLGYEIALSYQVNSTNAPKCTVLDQLVLKKWAKAVPLRFEDLKGIQDHLWRRPIHPQVYRTYPQAVNVSDTVNRLLQGRPIEEVSFD